MFKIPKNDSRFVWTNHAVGKMLHYGLSAQKVRSILSGYKRKEEGIAPNTVAVMKPAGSAKNPAEIWVMYQTENQKSSQRNKFGAGQVMVGGQKIIVISAWRYPGVSPVGKPIAIPEDVLAELENFNGGETAAEI